MGKHLVKTNQSVLKNFPFRTQPIAGLTPECTPVKQRPKVLLLLVINIILYVVVTRINDSRTINIVNMTNWHKQTQLSPDHTVERRQFGENGDCRRIATVAVLGDTLRIWR